MKKIRNKTNLNKIFIMIFITLYCFFNIQSISLSINYLDFNLADSSSVDVFAEGAVLMDENSGKILYGKNAYNRMYPASTTKIVTALLVLDNCNLSDMVNVSYYAIHSVPPTYTIMNLIPGESFSVNDLLHVLMIGSANDAAFVLAEYIANGGNNYLLDSSADAKNKFDESIAKFSNMMNEKAREIGCTTTNFVNPNGIHNENHYTTAYDLALIGRYAYKNSDLMSVCNTLSYSLPNTSFYTARARECKCTNALLYSDRPTYYEYANGMKTGYTDPAGYCMVATASKDNLDLIVVILKAKESSYSTSIDNLNVTREADCKRLFDFGFEKYFYTNLTSSGDVARSLFVFNGDNNTRSLDLIVKDDITALIAKDRPINITPNIKIYKYFAPITKGEVIGQVTYSLNGLTYNSDLIASHDVNVANYENIVWIIVSIFLVLLILVIIFSKRKKK